MRPTRTFLLLTAAGLLPAALPVLRSADVWTLWLGYTAAIALLLGIDAILLVRRSWLAVEARLASDLPIGALHPCEVRIDAGGRALPGLEVRAEVSPTLGAEATVRGERVDGGHRARVEIEPLRRGAARLEALWLRYRGPLGLMQAIRRIPIGLDTAVTPDVPAVKAIALRFEADRELRVGLQVERFKGEGTEFDSLKEFFRGDDRRAIDWKASARHGKLLCRQFRAERNHQVVLAVDSGRLMSEPLDGVPRLDHAINGALLLSWVGLRTGDRVGLYSFGARPGIFVSPRGGVASQPTIARASAEIAYGDAETNYTLGLTSLAHRIRRRSLIVVMTEFSDTITAELMIENLHRLARRHLVVFVTLLDTSVEATATANPRDSLALHRATVAQQMQEERAIVIGRLRRMGLLTIEARSRDVGAALINRYIDVRRRERI